MSRSTRCTALDDDTGKQCTCLKAMLPNDPDPEKPLRCIECLHGPSLHHGPMGKEAGDSVDDILRSLMKKPKSGGQSQVFKDAHKGSEAGLTKRSKESSGKGKSVKAKVRSSQPTQIHSILNISSINKWQGKGKGKLTDKLSVTFKVLVILINPEGVYYDVSNVLFHSDTPTTNTNIPYRKMEMCSL